MPLPRERPRTYSASRYEILNQMARSRVQRHFFHRPERTCLPHGKHKVVDLGLSGILFACVSPFYHYVTLLGNTMLRSRVAVIRYAFTCAHFTLSAACCIQTRNSVIALTPVELELRTSNLE